MPVLDHLYLHVPFCPSKCHYCGFYSVAATAEDRRTYAALPAAELDLRSVAADSVVQTVYVGGGSPGTLGADGLHRLFAGLRRRLHLDAVREWTVELNPECVTPPLLDLLRREGVNRISMGVQTFDEAVLSALGRRHSARAAAAGLAVCRDAGISRCGIDLIAGLPGLTEAAWRATLAKAVALEPEHVSVYALSVEPGTVLARQVAAGTVVPDADAQMTALALAETVLTSAGYERYEISNYSRPGGACRHNLACWRGEDYLGLGPAAASRAGLTRRTNAPDWPAYREAVTHNRLPPSEEEMLDAAEDATERFIFGLRLSEGVCPAGFARRHPAAAPLVAAWEQRLEGLVPHGITERVAPEASAELRWRLTARGREVADAVMRELV